MIGDEMLDKVGAFIRHKGTRARRDDHARAPGARRVRAVASTMRRPRRPLCRFHDVPPAVPSRLAAQEHGWRVAQLDARSIQACRAAATLTGKTPPKRRCWQGTELPSPSTRKQVAELPAPPCQLRRPEDSASRFRQTPVKCIHLRVSNRAVCWPPAN